MQNRKGNLGLLKNLQNRMECFLFTCQNSPSNGFGKIVKYHQIKVPNILRTPRFSLIFFACLLLFALPELFSWRSCRMNKGCNFNLSQVFLDLYVNSCIHSSVMYFSLEPLNRFSWFLALRQIIINIKKWKKKTLENFISCPNK